MTELHHQIHSLELTVARLDERVKSMLTEMEKAHESREKLAQQFVVVTNDLDDRLGPLADSMSRWKGALAMLGIISAGIGGAVSLLIQNWIGPPK